MQKKNNSSGKKLFFSDQFSELFTTELHWEPFQHNEEDEERTGIEGRIASSSNNINLKPRKIGI